MTTEVLQRSVTRNDQQDAASRTGAYVFNLWSGAGYGLAVTLPPRLPDRWTYETDMILRSTIRREAMWSDAVYLAISKQAALGFTVKDSEKSDRRIKRSQELLLNMDGGKGWVPGISKHLRDFLLTDNGAFLEIVRASRSRGSTILGLVHLSSARCWRTGDPDTPVIYKDLKGYEHELRDYQVLMFSDMADPDDAYFDIGFCAARRAYPTIYKLTALETYVAEKIAGTRALALHLVSGISKTSLESALATALEENAARNRTAYMGSIVVPALGDQGISVATIPLAEIPDGFDAKTERDNAYQKYANAIGIPVQDIQPLSGQGLGTGMQTVILEEASQGQGVAAWRKQWEHIINSHVLPAATTFSWATNDTRDQKAKAEVAKMRAETVSGLVEKGILKPDQGLQILADHDDVPEEFLPQDQTPEGQLTDSEKPVSDEQPDAPGGASAPTVAPSPLRQAINRTIAQMRQKESPEQLEALLVTVRDEVAHLTTQLESGAISLAEWTTAMDRTIEDGHVAAFKAASGGELDDRSRAMVERAIAEQRSYLRGFRDAMADALVDGWRPAWSQRAQMYAESTKASYWRGAVRGYPIPSVPGDGTTQCLTNCKCSLTIDELEGDGNADIYWRMSDAEHCQTCQERASQWAPLQIREGEVLL